MKHAQVKDKKKFLSVPTSDKNRPTELLALRSNKNLKKTL